MLYYSLNKGSVLAGFKEAVLNGQAPDGGLYFPRSIPKLPQGFVKQLSSKSRQQIAFEVMKPYVGNDLAEEGLFRICAHAVDFDMPLVQVNENISSLELFHGPTLAFKDVGARFMSACFAHFSRKRKWKTTILVATSGDTGGAVANGFLSVEGVEVVILYPSGKVSRIQEQQLTTLGNNVTALEVNGTFDDCQQMVKKAFADVELNKKLHLNSANSINIGRWLPQQFYYFFALQQWPHEEPPVISVPSGNFGNICAGLLAQASGLPVKHFIAACNSNSVFTDYLHSGEFEPRPAVATLSNAMDVGDPSNFYRVLRLFGDSHARLREKVSSFAVHDDLVLRTIAEVYQNHQYLCDPHGAVAYCLLEKYLEQHPGNKGIFLETAHPSKFEEAVGSAIGERVAYPASVKELLKREKKSIPVEPRYEALKEFLFYAKELVQ